MSTPESIAGVAPRLRMGLSRALLALGVLVALAVTVVILALTGSSRTGAGSAAVQAASQSPQNISSCVYVRAEHACLRSP